MEGFLHRQGRKIVDGQNREIILKGWGLGNWLLPEGYMWLSGDNDRFDRPRRIEQVVEELTGKAYAAGFWQEFRRRYVTQEDIRYMAELGYNSVRIPVNWRVLMEDAEEICWKEEGFALLDACLDWCEEEEMYAFLDLHGAPGGQTGANIDDSLDDVPRLFLDEDKKEKCIALWHRLAERYRNKAVVGGYDLLNEPICPPDGQKNFDALIPRLAQFYRELIADIRTVDPNHMLSIEGAHWATDLRIFEERFDENMVLHFHRYAEKPDRKCLDAYLAKAEELDLPLWLGESGENTNEWYAALYPLAVSMGIGYNLWPWKKMECTNSPCSIRKPENYDLVIAYTKQGKHPGYETSRKIFDEYLDNILLKNCERHPEVTNHVFRRAPFSMMAVDFDELPGEGMSFGRDDFAGKAIGAKREEEEYRSGTGMQIRALRPAGEERFVFDSQWDRYALVLEKGEFAEYTIEAAAAVTLVLEGKADIPTGIEISSGTYQKTVWMMPGMETVSAAFNTKENTSIRIKVIEGEAVLKKLHFRK